MVEAVVVIAVCVVVLLVGWGLIAAACTEACQEHHDHVDDF